MFHKKPPPQPERRRPITAVSQPRQQVFSYHSVRSARVDERSDERDIAKADTAALAVRRRQRVSFWRNARLVGVSLAVVLFLALDMVLGATPKVVTMSGNDSSSRIFLRSSSVYAAETHQLLAGSVLNRNKITIDTAHISASLLQRFPELTAVSMSLPVLGSQPVVYLQPATPKLVLQTQSSGSFVLDASGRALMDASQVANLSGLQLPTVADQSGIKVSVGQTALPAADVAFTGQIAVQFRAKGVVITSLTLPANSSELDVRISGAPYFIKCNLAANDARQEAGTFLAVRQYLATHNQNPATYVDVRVAGRAYYK